MAEQELGVAMEAPQECTLLDSAIPAEQTKYLPDVQELVLVHSEPENSLAHINPYWYSNPSGPVQQPERQSTSKQGDPLEQTKESKPNHLSGPLAAFEQPTFPEVLKSLEHAPSEAQAKPEEPLASVGNADVSKTKDSSLPDEGSAPLINMAESSSSHVEGLSKSTDDAAPKATLPDQAVSSEHISTKNDPSSAHICTPAEMPKIEPNGSFGHSQPFQVPDAVHLGDQMDTSEESHHPAQAGIWEQPDPDNDQAVVGRTLDVDVGPLILG